MTVIHEAQATLLGKKKESSDTSVPLAPSKELRVPGCSYLTKGNVRIWNGSKFTCIHNRTQLCTKGCHRKTRKFLARDCPHLVQQWSSNNPPIDNYTTGSNVKVEWICHVDPKHVWNALINNRTKKRPTGCPLCRLVHDPVAKRQKQDDPRDGKKQSTQIGDATEHWCAEQLRPYFSKVEVIGNTTDKTDVIVTLDDGSRRSIQCKTLSHDKNTGEDVYKVTKLLGYGKMLLMMVNNERTCFAVMMAENITTKSIEFRFASDHTKYTNFMFHKREVFVQRVVEQVPLAAEYIPNISRSTQKEIDMYKRLALWCERRGYIWKRNEHNDSAMDGWINGIPVQCKYRSSPSGVCYSIQMHTMAGTLNGRRITKPYAITSPFDFLVVELGGPPDQPDKYHGQFLFLPKEQLVEQDILSTSVTERGHEAVGVAPPDYLKSHWTLPFWNKFETDCFEVSPTEILQIQTGCQ